MRIETLVEGKIPVKALIDTSSKFNTISKRLFNKLKSNHGIRPSCGPAECLYGDVIGEINYLDLQFCCKGEWQSLDGTDAIYFKIRKNPTFDLVLGRGWLWVHEVKMNFKLSSKGSYDPHAKIVIDGMSILVIDEGSKPTGDSSSHKASSSKNNLSKSTESKPGLAQEEIMNIINKILLNIEDRLEESLLCRPKGASLKTHNKQQIFRNIPSAHPPSRRLNDDLSREIKRATRNLKKRCTCSTIRPKFESFSLPMTYVRDKLIINRTNFVKIIFS
ncbi:168_t:CDS:1 [Diversispora eburnea]|uniref:168_t:CDS:1 n=1 Tax=Diversispora eburnea TaxID=1213867 RepID=A0A9N9D5E1_9GLOM|nr:168_t:CDS:1 [Diversispora eburnea]